MVNTCPRNCISKCTVPVDLDEGEDTFAKIMVPKPETFIAVDLQGRIGAFLETNEKILGLKLMEKVDRNGWRDLPKNR